jgi:hypothetical protein
MLASALLVAALHWSIESIRIVATKAQRGQRPRGACAMDGL